VSAAFIYGMSAIADAVWFQDNSDNFAVMEIVIMLFNHTLFNNNLYVNYIYQI
jgi:hypothetical protein